MSIKGLGSETKVGLFVLAGIIILTYMTFRVGGLPFLKPKKGYVVYTYFDAVSGLDYGAMVRVVGVEAGEVEDIRIEGNLVKVTMRLRPHIKIRKGARARIRTMGLMGEKYIELTVGHPEESLLVDGATLERGVTEVGIDELTTKLGGVADDVKAVTSALRNVLGTREGEMRLDRIFANIDSITNKLSELILANETKMGRTIDNFESFSATLSQELPKLITCLQSVAEDVSTMVGEEEGDLRVSLQNIRKASAKLESTLDSVKGAFDNVEKITTEIDQGKGTVGKLVKEEGVYKNLDATLQGTRKMFEAEDRFKFFLGFQSDYVTRDDFSKSEFALRIQPREDRFYEFGVVNYSEYQERHTKEAYQDGQEVYDYTKVDVEENKVKFNALIAKRFYNVTVKGGLIESTGGVGVEYGLPKYNLALGVDAWDFSGNEQGGEDAPHLRATASYNIWKHIFLRVGADDFIDSERCSFFVGGGIRFQDDDLRYLLGKVPAGID